MGADCAKCGYDMVITEDLEPCCPYCELEEESTKLQEEIEKLIAENKSLLEDVRMAIDLMGDVELNLNNYTDDDVRDLQGNVISALKKLERWG